MHREPETAAPRRIAFVYSSLAFGGAERVGINLAAALKAEGYAIDFLLMHKSGEFLAAAMEAHTVIDLSCDKTWKLPFKLARYMHTTRPAAVISSFWKINLCLALARIFAPRTAIGLWEHSSPQVGGNSPTWLFAPTATLLYRLSTCIIAVSYSVANDIAARTLGLRHRIVTIGNAIPQPCLATQTAPVTARTIIWVGRFADVKNPHLMVDAFARLPAKAGYTLLFVGDGYLKEAVEERVRALGIGERVVFSGFHAEPAGLIAAADVLVLSSVAEGLPTVLIEALYLGVNVVSTECGGGVHDILEGGRFGSIVPNDDPDALARGITERLEQPIARDVLIAAGHRFEPAIIARKVLHALKLLRVPNP